MSQHLVAAGSGPPKRPLAIISGGSSGIGLSVAEVLGKRGCTVAILARDPARLAQARANLEAQRIVVSAHALDVRDVAACTALVDSLVSEHGPPLWVVASAGIVEPGFFLEQDAAATLAQMEINFLGTTNLVRAAAPSMVAAGRGHIAMVASAAGLFGVAGYAGYCASKFAVRGFAEALRIELAAAGVSVTVSVPPDTDTPQLAYERPLRPAAIAPFAGSGRPLPPQVVAAHLVRTAERGGFLSAPTAQLAAIARMQGLASGVFARVQMRLLRRNKP
ncbi:SDR family NAD(P)-dependent oxidoreductase [Xanthobacter sp. YC-JY1]|uniref:SDR family NAD(P)-dependent oxidoreductase n=1 Tax=Xanthobacter sp. YC-JY1 TaxID=2419844 RepID=UPI001F2F5755|nr:SDR family NAD(P)-dependent oxidoreductase [Xanthobacter sp. YC-JY1]UJX45062.1 SDR family NAD(P)-dependent oxidoreductase [Xanthobacter sp. YC-JY1]